MLFIFSKKFLYFGLDLNALKRLDFIPILSANSCTVKDSVGITFLLCFSILNFLSALFLIVLSSTVISFQGLS